MTVLGAVVFWKRTRRASERRKKVTKRLAKRRILKQSEVKCKISDDKSI